MTKAQMRAEVFRRLHESSTAPVFWTADDVDAAIDEAYAEISDATEWYEVTATIDKLADRPYYDLRTVIDVATPLLSVGPAFDVDSNRWYTPTSLTALDGFDRRWERVVDAPQRLVVRGLWWLGLWPRTRSESGTWTQLFTALPPALEDSDEPGFPASFHRGLVEFALADLWAQDAETARALQAWGVYLAIEQGLQQWVDGRASGPWQRGYAS